MKKCPFCAEEIQDEAVKCRFCGEFLENAPQAQPKVPWYFRTAVIVIAILSVGPFALPLVWRHPRYSRKTKWIVTVLVLAASYGLYAATREAVKTLQEYYSMLTQSM